MKTRKLLAATLIAATALSPVAYAASQADSAKPQAQQTMGDQTATKASSNSSANSGDVKDFAKLSTDGFDAFRNLQMARLAIFDGRTDQAKTFVENAQASLKTAQSDGTAFEKAEADMKQPQGMAGHGMKAGGVQKTSNSTSGQAGQSNTKTASADASKPGLWLPIDGQILLGEDYEVTPENSQAVTKANDALKSGDRQAAADQLKLAGVDLQFAMALVPLKTTVSNVDQAAKDLDAGKYYEANLDLKKIQDGVVVDLVDVVGTPKADGNKAAQVKKDQPYSKTDQHASQTSEKATN